MALYVIRLTPSIYPNTSNNGHCSRSRTLLPPIHHGSVGVVISCVGILHSNRWRANLLEVRPLIINSFYFPQFKAALMLFEVRCLFEVLGYV